MRLSRVQSFVFGAAALAALWPCTTARGQCEAQWLAGEGVPGVDGEVYAIREWDPDGPGPQVPLVVVGGSFSFAGSVAANNIAVFDRATGEWSTLGAGTDREVNAVAQLADGDLVVAGRFTTVGGIAASGVARYDACEGWTALGSGISSSNPDWTVFAVVETPSGDIVVGGQFTAAGDAPAKSIARYTPATGAWSPLGQGIGNIVDALAVLPNGDIFAGGRFTTAGGVSAKNIARYRAGAQSWSALGTGTSGGYSSGAVFALGVRGDDLIVGGGFVVAGGVPASRVARYNPVLDEWSPLGSGIGDDGSFAAVAALTTLPGGDVIVAGGFSVAGGVPASNIARFNQAAQVWTDLGSGIEGLLFAVSTAANGELFTGGLVYSLAGGVPVSGVARHNLESGEWGALGEEGFASFVFVSSYRWPIAALAAHPNGDIFVGGGFTGVGGISSNSIARYDPRTGQWASVGGGVQLADSGAFAAVNALAVLPGGDVVAGGTFDSAGGQSANSIARFNLQTGLWSALGTGLTFSGYESGASELVVLPTGEVIVGGRFDSAGDVPANHIASYNPASGTWDALGIGVDQIGPLHADQAEGVFALALAGGELIVGGTFDRAGGVPVGNIAKYAIATGEWVALGPGVTGGTVTSIVVLPDGDLIVGGRFASAGVPGTQHIARYSLATDSWSALGGEISGTGVGALVVLSGGDVVVGGDFTSAGGVAARNIARYNPAANIWSAMGSGCDGAVESLAALPENGFVAGGSFLRAGDKVAAQFARWSEAARYYVPNPDGGWVFDQAWSDTPEGAGGAGVPQIGDSVFILSDDAIAVYYGPDYAAPGIRCLTIGGAGVDENGPVLYQVLGSLVISGDEYVGVSGFGAHVHLGGSKLTGGSNTVGGSIIIGKGGFYAVTAGTVKAGSIINNGFFWINDGATLDVAGVVSGNPVEYPEGGTSSITGGTITAPIVTSPGTHIAKTTDATLTISGAQSYGAQTMFEARGGLTVFTEPMTDGTMSMQLNASCSTTVRFALDPKGAAAASVAGIEINAPGNLELVPGSDEVLISGALSIDVEQQCRMDVGDNAFVLDHDDEGGDNGAGLENAIRVYIRRGRNGNGDDTWTGTGILCGIAGLAGNDTFALAMMNNDDGSGNPIVPTFPPGGKGVPVDASSILVWYTREGDSDLDGDVDTGDLAHWIAGFEGGGRGERGGPPLEGWRWGDYDYDGDIDGADATLLARAYYEVNGSLQGLLDMITMSAMSPEQKAQARAAICAARECQPSGPSACVAPLQDVSNFLAAWFARLPSADVNESGEVTVQDLFDFLREWLGRCG